MDPTDRPQFVEHVNKSLNITINDVKWVPSSARFVVLGSTAKGAGALYTYALRDGDAHLLGETEKSSAFKCATFAASSLEERHLATGDFEGKMAVWDLEHPGVPLYSVKAHPSMLNAIDGCAGQGVGYGAPEIVTAGRDGAVRVWDPRQKDRPVAALEAKEGQSRDCWSVAFGNSYNVEERVVAAGYDNGDIKLYDLRTNMIRWETNIRNGVCGLQFDRKDIEMNKLVATTLESQFTVFDMRTYHPKEGYTGQTHKGHQSTVWLARHLPQNRDVWVTGGGNGTVSMWKYKYPVQRSVKDNDGHMKGVAGEVEELQTKNFSTQPIASFDWSADKQGLCVMGAYDQQVRVCIVTKLNSL